MKRVLILAAALVAAVAVFIARTIPPARRTLATQSDGTVAGVLHVHTNRSDGRSTPEEIAAIAARVGLKFIVLTDHGDATRTPDPPTYRSGVLCLDGVEISTTGGHYLAIGMPASPYPLGGEPRDVVDDVRRLGGFGIVAHPDSPKPALQWQDWAAPFDAIEWVNPDTSWRARMQWPGRRARLHLVSALVDYPIRPAETIAGLLEGTTSALFRWNVLTRRRRVVALAGVDAHARLALRASDPIDNRFSVALPSYEASFRTLSVRVRPDRPLTGDAASDAAIVMRALRSGHAYTAIDGIASPPSFEFTATNELGTVREGNELAIAGPVTLRVRSNAPPEFTTTIWDGSTRIASDIHEQEVAVRAPPGPAVYHVEIRARTGNGELPWILSNPIYVRALEMKPPPPVGPPPSAGDPLFDGRTGSGWRVEHDQVSDGTLDVPAAVSGAELRLRYGLGGGAPSGQFVALVADTPTGIAPNDRIAITMRADHPCRVSIQLRSANGGGERWQQSTYVDAFDRQHTIHFDDLTPVGATSTPHPPLDQVRSILFVIDTTHAKPGTSGRLWIKGATLQR